MSTGITRSSTHHPANSGTQEAEQQLTQALRDGDETAFLTLVWRHQRTMLCVARLYVAGEAAAEDVVQETWLAVLRGLPRFEGRSSLRTWIFRILTRRAQSYGQRDARSVPFTNLLAPRDDDGPAVSPDRFRPDGEWATAPASWENLPEERLLAAETQAMLDQAIAALPAGQRAVITLRDVEGWPSDEICALLQISDANQRVLLHRARSRVRAALEHYLAAL